MRLYFVMPGFMPGIYVLQPAAIEDVDGTGTRACPSSVGVKCHMSGKPDIW